MFKGVMIYCIKVHQQTLGLTAEDYSRLQQTTVVPVVPVVPVEKDIFCAALCSAAVVCL